jgi:HSP20 family protein
MLAKWDPFRDLVGVEEEFDRLIGRMASHGAWVPALDVRETEERFEVTVDLPGLDPENVNVTFENAALTISGTRELAEEEKQETYHRIERSYGTFARSVRLPRTADASKIEATFDRGVLRVSVPKTEAAKPRTIEVRST